MIPDYKLYHGAVLADLVDRARKPILIEEVTEEGRLLNYLLNGKVGLQIRFATQRIRPWPFTFSPHQVRALQDLKDKCGIAYLALVCGQDGIVTIEASEALPALLETGDRQAWLRVDRRKREHYRLTGPLGEFKRKYPTTTEAIIEVLELGHGLEDLDDLVPHAAPERLVS